MYTKFIINREDNMRNIEKKKCQIKHERLLTYVILKNRILLDYFLSKSEGH